MSITGYITNSMFRRYNITSDDDLRAAMKRVSAYVTERQRSLSEQGNHCNFKAALVNLDKCDHDYFCRIAMR